jgi:hypothetical protein
VTSPSSNIDSRDLACEIARIIDEKKGEDIVVLPVGDVVGITEYFVVASASNARLVGAVTDAVFASLTADPVLGRKWHVLCQVQMSRLGERELLHHRHRA